MKSFHLPTTTPQDWFKKINTDWHAKTHFGNTVGENFLERLHYARKIKRNEPVYKKAEVFLVSPELKTFIPVSCYDEHEDGKPLIKEIYHLNPDLFTSYRPYGLNTPITQEDNKKLYKTIKTLKEDGYDISGCKVYVGYLSDNVNKPKITAEEYLQGKYNTDIIQIPLTQYGDDIKTQFELFRDIFSTQKFGKFNVEKMKYVLKSIFYLLNKQNMFKKKEYEFILDKINQYDENKISDQELENILFGYNGFRNTIHNRIRNRIEDQQFIDLVGNPKLLNNLLSAM